MKRVLFLNLCLLVALIVNGADWTAQEVDKFCSIKFPGQPIKGYANGIRSYTYVTDSCNYLVQVEPTPGTEAITDSGKLHVFYLSVVNAIIRGYRASLIGSKPVAVSGLSGQEVTFVKPASAGHLPVSVCSRILLLNGRMIVYSFSAPVERFIPQKKNQDNFFASFSINSNDTVKQYNANTIIDSDIQMASAKDSAAVHSAAVHTELVRPNTLHFIVSFVVAILLLAGGLYVVVSLIKRRENK